MIISLSTSYLQPRYGNDGYSMMKDAAELGFEYVELGHSTTPASIDGIMKALDEGFIKVSSTHAFCPVPPFARGAAPNLFSPSTSSKLESSQWLRHMTTTLEVAAMAKAKTVVAHCGMLSHFLFKLDSALMEILNANGDVAPTDNSNFNAIRDKFMLKSAKRTEKKDYKYLRANLEALYSTLQNLNLTLGIENRESPAELPLDWNFDTLFNAITHLPQVQVWHDVGHSKKKELMGLGSPLALIEKTADKICGWHLHDCNEAGKDHIGIGKGCINFKELAPFFDKQKHIFTLEINRRVSRSDVADSLKIVQDLLQ